MSGGVDSSVAARLLIDEGFEVVGLFMHNWEDEENGQCTSADDWADVQAVCGKLKIPCYSVNFAAQYMDRVFSYFLDEYKKGRTPNPDVLCNREIKFGPFRDYAFKLGADFIATGHYCGVGNFEGGAQLLKAKDELKDQTYFLNQVTTSQLENVMFPLADLIKSEVRAIAVTEGLVTAKKKDSTGICFIGERKFKKFLSEYLPAQYGDIVDLSGKIVGRHDGLMYYTLGQRRGLGIGGIKDGDANRWYVVEKDLNSNRLIVSNGEGEELFSSALETHSLNIIGIDDLPPEFEAAAKTRYRQAEQKCAVRKRGTGAYIEFNKPQRAVTPGQYVVIYKGERCIGGGVIEKTFK